MPKGRNQPQDHAELRCDLKRAPLSNGPLRLPFDLCVLVCFGWGGIQEGRACSMAASAWEGSRWALKVGAAPLPVLPPVLQFVAVCRSQHLTTLGSMVVGKSTGFSKGF